MVEAQELHAGGLVRDVSRRKRSLMMMLIGSFVTLAAFAIAPSPVHPVPSPRPAQPGQPVGPPFARTLPGDGGPAVLAAVTPGSVAVDSVGNVFIGDYVNHSVRKVAAGSGIITSVAYDVVTAGSQVGLAIDRGGNILVADAQGCKIRKIAAGTGAITTIAGVGAFGFSGDGGPAFLAQLSHPFGVAVDASGNVLVAEWSNHRVRRIDAVTGMIATIAGDGSSDYSGDGGPATAAGLANPSSVAVDAAGNVFIADWANNLVNRVRKVSAGTGIITTFAGTGFASPLGDGGPATEAGLAAPYGVAVDGAGNVFIADITAERIRMVAVETGIITTIAGSGWRGDFSGDGGPATLATLNQPLGVAVDAEGNVFIADTHNYRVRRVDAATGVITTIAGDGTPSADPDRVPPRRRATDSN